MIYLITLLELLEERYEAEVTGRGGRRRKRLLGELMDKRGYWKLEEALDLAV